MSFLFKASSKDVEDEPLINSPSSNNGESGEEITAEQFSKRSIDGPSDEYNSYVNKDKKISHEEQEKKRIEAAEELLNMCAEKELAVPDAIKAAILGKELDDYQREHGINIDNDSSPSAHAPDLFMSCLSIHKELVDKMKDNALFQEIHQLYKELNYENKKLSCKVIGGNYTIINKIPIEEKDDNDNVDDNEEGKKKKKNKNNKGTKQTIKTVQTESPIFKLKNNIWRLLTKGRYYERTKTIESILLNNVNLNLQSGKLYLVLGAPGSGKSTLLKYIANTLRKDSTHKVNGEVIINNNMKSTNKELVWSNLVSYIDQIDRLHKYLTVGETLEFAWKCRMGSTHGSPYKYDMDNPTIKAKIDELDANMYKVDIILRSMGLKRVQDTFVGDNGISVRGVSGGEKKRVTVSEIMCTDSPILCMDEISTGLDAATTYDICKLLSATVKLFDQIKIISLLQPPPETVAEFDEIILIHDGCIIYSGPTDNVVQYFESLGYKIPERMDPADWLQALPTSDGKEYLVNKENGSKHLSTKEFVNKFIESEYGQKIHNEIQTEVIEEEGNNNDEETAITTSADNNNKNKIQPYDEEIAKKQYANNAYQSLKLLIKRELTLWWRDKYYIKSRIMSDLIMGIVAGTLFWQQGPTNPQSTMGILFQSMFFISVGAMLKVPEQFDYRGILYKQQDANFFPTWTYVAGRSIAAIPTSVIDGILYGTVIYWFVGLAWDDGASIGNYFLFMLCVLMASLSAGLQFSIYSAIMRDKVVAQAAMSLTIILFVLFSGFTVQPAIIPNYWIWVYWMNMFAWILRSLVVNEYQSGKYDYPATSVDPSNPYTYGETILINFGFTLNGEPFTFEWVWYGLLFTVGISIIAIFGSSYFLSKIRFDTGQSLAIDLVDDNDNAGNEQAEAAEEEDDDDEEEEGAKNPDATKEEEVNIPFQKVNLTFKDIHYTVTSSITNEELELLKGIDGYLEAGKMTALMGSSGAGKTTLMDVLALRKTSGTITGEVMLNGHLQDEQSFRRCTGYVEQFDVQSPQLTIRETVEFSARLRLEETDEAVTDESRKKFVDETLDMLELLSIQDLQVGDDISGGLSFEQNKRLSIAVELASNPSILFLDEPTSGLDARAASIVMRGLKRIALTGRAVCATIHQPSIAIFTSFDSLLLLKRGGEVVFFGELGDDSINLINYLERYEATPRIQGGENPATWMLTTIGAGSSASGKPFDYAGSYSISTLHEKAVADIDNFNSNPTNDSKVSFPNKYATNGVTQRWAVLRRTMTIYWRSPSYNMVRMMISLIVALLFGSVYVSQRVPSTEGDMMSRITSIFVTVLFLAVNAQNTVLAVFERERNMFYRHKAALMYDQTATVIAFTLAEIPFIALSAMIFTCGWYFLVGFDIHAGKFFMYYLFMALTLGNFTFMGQMLVSVLRDSATAQGLGGLVISMTSMFTGILIRPQDIPNFWIWAYWLFPGHYIMEGLLTSQYKNDNTPITPNPGSAFCEWVLQSNSDTCSDIADCTTCTGTAEDWIHIEFGGAWEFENLKWDLIYLVGLMVATKSVQLWALTYLNYLSN